MAITVDNDNLVTEAQLQAHPGMSGVTDAQAVVLIPTATSRIKKYLNRKRLVCTQEDVTIYMDGSGGLDLWFPDGPITEVVSLTDDTNRDFATGDITIDNDHIVIYGGYQQADSSLGDGEDFPSRIQLLSASGGFAKGALNVKFVGRVGYNDEDDQYPLPDDLKEACKELCAWMFNIPMPGIKSQRTQTYSYTAEEIKNGMPTNVRALLGPYVRQEIY